MSNHQSDYCIENDLPAQQEMAAIHEAKEKSAEVTHIQELTSALKCCLGLLNRLDPENTRNNKVVIKSMALIKKSNCF